MTLSEIKTSDVKFWQKLLRLGGYYKGSIDGVKGPNQIAAEAAWDADVAKYKAEYGVFDSRTEGNLDSVIPAMQKEMRIYLAKAVPYAKEQWDITVKVIQGTRSYSEQDALYAKGRTKSGSKVTNARGGYSNHNFGLANDLGLFSASGSYLTSGTYYDKLAKEVGTQPELIWGGSWKNFPDSPHYQLAKYGASTAGIRKIF